MEFYPCADLIAKIKACVQLRLRPRPWLLRATIRVASLYRICKHSKPFLSKAVTQSYAVMLHCESCYTCLIALYCRVF